MAKLVKGSKAAKDYMAKIRAKKVGATLFVEKGESPSKPKYTKVLQRNRTPIGKPKAGTFRGNTRIGDIHRQELYILKAFSPYKSKASLNGKTIPIIKAYKMLDTDMEWKKINSHSSRVGISTYYTK